MVFNRIKSMFLAGGLALVLVSQANAEVSSIPTALKALEQSQEGDAWKTLGTEAYQWIAEFTSKFDVSSVMMVTPYVFEKARMGVILRVIDAHLNGAEMDPDEKEYFVAFGTSVSRIQSRVEFLTSDLNPVDSPSNDPYAVSMRRIFDIYESAFSKQVEDYIEKSLENMETEIALGLTERAATFPKQIFQMVGEGFAHGELRPSRQAEDAEEFAKQHFALRQAPYVEEGYKNALPVVEELAAKFPDMSFSRQMAVLAYSTDAIDKYKTAKRLVDVDSLTEEENVEVASGLRAWQSMGIFSQKRYDKDPASPGYAVTLMSYKRISDIFVKDVLALAKSMRKD